MIACPGCAGNLKFDIASQQMKCEFCGNLYDPYQFDSKEKDAESGLDAYDVHVFKCPQCGGELYTTDEQTAAFCSFCGASTILYERMDKAARPKFIIPFGVSKADCRQAYLKRTKKALFLPKEMKREESIDSFRGVYVPYWSYDVSQKGNVNLKGETTRRSGDYIITDKYALTGDVDAFYNGIMHDASSSLYDDISAQLAPYDVKKKKEFTAAYLSGFYADGADVVPSAYEQEVIWFTNRSSFDKLDKSIFGSVSVEKPKELENAFNSHIDAEDLSMMPVWFMSYRNRDRVAYATVNGQTGKVVADFPISVTKYLLAALIVFVPLFLILNLLFTLTPNATMVISAIAAIITRIVYSSERSSIEEREDLSNDKGMVNAVDKDGNYKYRGTFKRKKSPAAKSNKFLTAAFYITCVAGFFIWMEQLVNDAWYYGIAIAFAIVAGLTFVDIIKKLNVLSTHKLPQFEMRGGDDRAK